MRTLFGESPGGVRSAVPICAEPSLCPIFAHVELVQSRAWLDCSHLCSQSQRSKADESAGLSCEVNAGEREGDEEINDEQSDDTINRPITVNAGKGSKCRREGG